MPRRTGQRQEAPHDDPAAGPGLAARRPPGGDGTTVTRVHTDTRTCCAGDLFVALKGERFDANLVAEAGAGAVAALVPRRQTRCRLGSAGHRSGGHPLALGQLAAGWRVSGCRWWR